MALITVRQLIFALSIYVLLLDPDFVIWDPGSAMERIRIRDKHPGSAFLLSYFQISNWQMRYAQKI